MSHASTSKPRMAPLGRVAVVSMNEDGARKFVTQYLGMPEGDITTIEDRGLSDDSRYKAGARLFWVRFRDLRCVK